MSQSNLVDARPILTSAPVSRGAELVNKIATSAPFSSKKRKCNARKKLARVIKEQQRHAKRSGLRAIAVTLTYSDCLMFDKKHISDFLGRLRKSLKRAGHTLSYAWVLERASKLHYHLIIWLPRSYSLDDTRLAKWWSWGSTWRECCQSVKAWGKYLAKFDSIVKLPKGARLFSYGGLDNEGKTAVSRVALPLWLIVLLPRSQRARRFPGGGWVNMETGERYPSPYIWTSRGAKLIHVSKSAYRLAA